MTDETLGVGMPCGGTMDIFVEPVLPKPELLIVGHGRIAETLAVLGDLMASPSPSMIPPPTAAPFPRRRDWSPKISILPRPPSVPRALS
jgi:xanthine dehydrogenase accessory factor